MGFDPVYQTAMVCTELQGVVGTCVCRQPLLLLCSSAMQGNLALPLFLPSTAAATAPPAVSPCALPTAAAVKPRDRCPCIDCLLLFVPT